MQKIRSTLLVAAALTTATASSAEGLQSRSMTEVIESQRALIMGQVAATVSSCQARFGPVEHKRRRYGPAFYHPIEKGCWSCPIGYVPMPPTYDIRGPRGCSRGCSTQHRPAIRHGPGQGMRQSDCPSAGNQFFDRKTGFCYSCPKGWIRRIGPSLIGPMCQMTLPCHFAPGLYRGPRPISRQQ
jgi:hypothetical protein